MSKLTFHELFFCKGLEFKTHQPRLILESLKALKLKKHKWRTWSGVSTTKPNITGISVLQLTSCMGSGQLFPLLSQSAFPHRNKMADTHHLKRAHGLRGFGGQLAPKPKGQGRRGVVKHSSQKKSTRNSTNTILSSELQGINPSSQSPLQESRNSVKLTIKIKVHTSYSLLLTEKVRIMISASYHYAAGKALEQETYCTLLVSSSEILFICTFPHLLYGEPGAFGSILVQVPDFVKYIPSSR